MLLHFQMLFQIYFIGQRRQGGPGVIYLKVLLPARHSLRFSPFLLTSREVGALSPILQRANLRLTECVNFPGSHVYTLPSTQIKQQPPVLDDRIPGLKRLIVETSPDVESGLCHAPHWT